MKEAEEEPWKMPVPEYDSPDITVASDFHWFIG
jgi:hypothetical protein